VVSTGQGGFNAPDTITSGMGKRFVLSVYAGREEKKAARDCTIYHQHLDTTEL